MTQCLSSSPPPHFSSEPWTGAPRPVFPCPPSSSPASCSPLSKPPPYSLSSQRSSTASPATLSPRHCSYLLTRKRSVRRKQVFKTGVRTRSIWGWVELWALDQRSASWNFSLQAFNTGVKSNSGAEWSTPGPIHSSSGKISPLTLIKICSTRSAHQELLQL